MPENEKTLTPQEIAEQRKVAEQKKISSVTAPATPGATVQGPSASEQAITKAYDDAIGQTSLLIKGLEGRRANAQQQDETAQRKSRNMQMIAGISDGLASLANLIGVGDRGTHIDMGPGALTPLQQKFENARLERKADIKSIDDRLDQYRRQLDQMRMQKGLAVAQQKERERADAKEQSRFNIEMAFKKAETERGAKERANALQEQIRHNKAQEQLTRDEIQARKYIANKNAETELNSVVIRYGSGGGKDTIPFVIDDPTSGKQRVINLPDKSLNNILAAYLPVAVKNGEVTEEQADDAKNWRSNEVSKTNLLGMVNSSVTMRNALLTAVNEQVNETDDSEEEQTVSFNPNPYLYNQQSEPGWAVKYQ